MLAVFDIDGTLCDSQEVEGQCFATAIERVTGNSLETLDWSKYNEPTSSSIVRDLLAGDVDAIGKEQAIKIEFCRLLEENRQFFPGDFMPLLGAVEFVERLQAERICGVAIATGCFGLSAQFKLECCGMVMDHIPNATSSDAAKRTDIISLAASRAGFGLVSVIYFGDGPWDVHAARALEIPMIGIGRRHERLRELGVRHVVKNYAEPDLIVAALHALRDGEASWSS